MTIETSDKKLFDNELDEIDSDISSVSERAVGDYVVLKTDWSNNAQVYMKSHIVTAIDTVSLGQAAKDIRTAHLSKYGGTVAVCLMKGYHAWASNTNFYYHARYKNVYIGIWSSD